MTTSELFDGEDGDPRGKEVLGTVASGQKTGDELRQANLALVDVGGVVGDQVDTRDLLEHLVDVGEHGTMEVTILAHGEQILEAALLHLEHDVLDGTKFVLDEGVVGRETAESAEHAHGLVFLTLEDEPTWRFGQLHDRGDDDHGEEDLEGNGESPRDTAGFGVVEAKIDPVTDADTASDQSLP